MLVITSLMVNNWDLLVNTFIRVVYVVRILPTASDSDKNLILFQYQPESESLLLAHPLISSLQLFPQCQRAMEGSI